MTIALIIILIIVCGFLGFQLSKKVKVDKQTEEYNNTLKITSQRLQKDCDGLRYLLGSISYDLQCQQLQLEEKQNINNELENKINNNRVVLQNTIEQNQAISDNAFDNYWNALENKYTELENDFDVRVSALNDELLATQNDLDKLKATRAAAHEALLKEQEIKDNKDDYRLIPSESEKRDIKLLNSIKKELINERPVNMIIWQTYYSKRANELCSRILGTRTITGIYKITEISTGKCYIGQSKNIKERFREHMKCGLGIDTPSGNKLYQAMLNSSIEDFTFELIEECEPSTLNEKEKYFISLYQSYDYGFNSNRGNNGGT